MQEIKLSQGKVTKVDDDLFDYLNQWKWCAIKHRNTFYVDRGNHNEPGYDTTNIWMHRVIMNAPKGLLVDHRDHDGLNNQRSNLRICSNEQNLFNRIIQINNTTGYKGVVYNEKYNKWIGQITCNKKCYRQWFDDKDDAAEFYNKMAIELFGEFAYLNKINR